MRDRSSSTVIDPPPWRAVEVMDFTPSTWVIASSRGSTRSLSTASGEAPSQLTEMLIVGKSTSGNWLMPMRCAATRPKRMVAAINIHAKTGFLMQASVMLMAWHLLHCYRWLRAAGEARR